MIITSTTNLDKRTTSKKIDDDVMSVKLRSYLYFFDL